MKLEIKWALIFSIVSLIWAFVEKAAGFHDTRLEQHPWFTMLFFFPAVAMYVFAIRDKRRELGGAISFKQIFMFGLGVSVIVAALSPLMQWIVQRVISPNYFSNIIKHSVETGRMTQQQAEAFFNLNSYMLQASIFGLVAGVATTLVLAAIMRSKMATQTA